MRFLAVLAVCLSMFASPSHAAPPDCDASREGTIIYNKDRKLVQFCNGDAWIGMVAKIGGTGDTLSDLTCQNDEVPVWNGAAWVCGTGGGDSLWSDSGQGYLIYDGEKGVKLANITGMAAPELSIGDFGCNANEILKWDGDSWECAADASGMSGLPALTSANIWVGNGSNAAAPVTISGDAVLSNSGVLTLGSDVVSTTNIVNGTIARADLADSIINSSAIADGQVTGTDIAATTITNANIANATIVATTKLSATGTKSSSTFLRGDNTWATPSGGGVASSTIVTCNNGFSGCTATCAAGWFRSGCHGNLSSTPANACACTNGTCRTFCVR